MAYIIMDTLDMELTRHSDGSKVLSTTTTLGAISQSVTEDRLKAGIGAGDIAVITSEQEMAVNVTDAVFSPAFLEVTQGVKFAEGTTKVSKRTTATVTDNAGTLSATIPNAPAGLTQATVVESNGETTEVTVTTGKFTVPVGVEVADKGVLTVIYETDVTGDVLEFDITKQSENFKCQLSTIMYDSDTMEIVKNLYIVFDNVKPSKAFDLSFEMSNPIAPELNLMVLKPKNSNILGRIVFEDVQ